MYTVRTVVLRSMYSVPTEFHTTECNKNGLPADFLRLRDVASHLSHTVCSNTVFSMSEEFDKDTVLT